MPKVGGKTYPYTSTGRKAAAKAKKAMNKPRTKPNKAKKKK